jgi:dynein light chain 1
MIDRISNLQGLSCLKILSLGRNNIKLGRNNIKKIEGLDAVADTLEELWMSYNNIEKLAGIEMCKKLKNVYFSNNKIKAWDGLTQLVILKVMLGIRVK